MRAREVAIVCPAGFERIVARAARRDLAGFYHNAIGGGFVRGSTTAPAKVLRRFPCATNVFEVLATTRRNGMDRELADLARKVAAVARPAGLPSTGAIRLRIHDDGTFASTGDRAARRLEDALSRWSGLRVSRARATLEYWVLRRTDLGDVVLGAKLTPQSSVRPQRGTLAPPVASCLARIAELDSTSMVLDPFAGSGAIGRACLEAGAGRVWINDPRSSFDEDLKHLGGTRLRRTSVDFRALEIDPGTVTTVVTDPPWGIFQEIEKGIEVLYTDFGRAARTWLGSTGSAVLLTGAPDKAVNRFLDAGGFALELDERVLINGRKARVLHAH